MTRPPREFNDVGIGHHCKRVVSLRFLRQCIKSDLHLRRKLPIDTECIFSPGLGAASEMLAYFPRGPRQTRVKYHTSQQSSGHSQITAVGSQNSDKIEMTVTQRERKINHRKWNYYHKPVQYKFQEPRQRLSGVLKLSSAANRCKEIPVL